MFVVFALPLFALIFGYFFVRSIRLLTPSGRERLRLRTLSAARARPEWPLAFCYEAIARRLAGRGSANDWRWVLWTGASALVGMLFSCVLLLVLALILMQL
ncbi:MAG TPA: hypothetical protein VFD32_16125 [Dehalococcoidia bacterium]|nr:hypothetical protein [Dehalococcoidia bacterium]